MSIERAVVHGLIAGTVQTRAMFTCDVVPSGGDTSQVLWEAYLHSIYTPVTTLVSSAYVTTLYELQSLSGGHWINFDEVLFPTYGTVEGDILPNLVSGVLIAKAMGLRHVGRKFWSAIPEAMTTFNSFTAGAAAIAGSILAAYITPFEGLGGGTITPGVVDNLGVFHEFVGGFVSSLLGTMRRRKPGLGI